MEELIGDDIPYHLRSDSAPLAVCSKCGRETYSQEEVGKIDHMVQPDRSSCGGVFKEM